MNIQSINRSRTVSSDITINYVEVVPGIIAWKHTETTTTTLGQGKPKTHETVMQGLSTDKSVSNFRKGHAGSMTSLPGDPILFTDDALAQIKRFGYSALRVNNFALMKENREKGLYDYIVGGGAIKNIVLFNGSDHMFYRVDGSLLPVGIRFNYIEGQMRSGLYDLTKVLELLKDREDVTFTGDDGYPHTYDDLVAEPKIETIPYYNNESGMETMLSFFFTPSEEQMKKIGEIREASKRKVKSGSYSYVRSDNIIDIILAEDMLGIASAKHEKEIKFPRDEDDRW